MIFLRKSGETNDLGSFSKTRYQGLVRCSQALSQRKSSYSAPPRSRRIVQTLSHVQPFATPWNAVHQAPLSFTLSQSLLKVMSIESVMPSNLLLLRHPPLLLPSVFPSIRVFSNESALRITWPKYWSFSFSFSISPSSECSGLISFRIDWLNLLAVQRTLKSLLQHHSSKASILQHSGKTIALTRQTFVGKVMSLLFNMPSRLLITFFPGVSIF